MTSITQNFWSYELINSTLIIDSTFQLTSISLILTKGTGTFQGSAVAGGLPSTLISLFPGMPITLSADSDNFISNLQIDATGGVISILGKQ